MLSHNVFVSFSIQAQQQQHPPRPLSPVRAARSPRSTAPDTAPIQVTQLRGGRGSASSVALIRSGQIKICADYSHVKTQADVCSWAFPFLSVSILPAGTSKENTMSFCCKYLLSVNLVCTCLLILNAITITIALRQSKSVSHTLTP